MKKIMIAAAAALCATVGFSSIESDNIVGYETTTVLAGKYSALAVQFENVGETSSIAIPNLVSSASFAGGTSAGAVTADQIWRWNTNNNNWDKYYYRTERKTIIGWCKDGESKVTEDTIEAGETFFFYRGGSSDITLTLAGQVKAFAATAEYSTPSGKYVFMGYPWPLEMKIGGFEKYQGAPAGGTSAGAVTADQIWRWNTTKNDWEKYYYRTERKTVIGWCKDGTSTVTEDVIPAGEGFFFYRGGSTNDKVTFTAPAE